MQTIVLSLLLLFGATVQAQNNNRKTVSDAVYAYYAKGQSFETMQKTITNYEGLIILAGYKLKEKQAISQRDYGIIWQYKVKGGMVVNVQMRYQFLKPYFKITLDYVIAFYPNGNAEMYAPDSPKKETRELYADLYDLFVTSFIKMAKPAKTLTQKQLRDAISNIDKLP